MRLIQETYHDRQGEEALTYLYEDGSYVPLARIDHHAPAANDGTKHDTVYYFHNDVSGIPEELTDAGGELVWQARYKVWGNAVQEEWVQRAPARTMVAQGERQVTPSAYAPRPQNLRFQGQYLDRETGLHYNTFRFYDPDVGRFINKDPVGLRGGVNFYQYAPNAVGWIDPLGLARIPSDVLGRKVYQDDSLIDTTTPVSEMSINQTALNSPSFDKLKGMINNGATNQDLMGAGYAPFGPDGNQVNLHHVLGDEPGPMVELSASTHQKYYRQLHGLIEDGNSFRNDPAAARGYDRFRKQYWKERARNSRCS
jgi:RHS repeat-associated protein